MLQTYVISICRRAILAWTLVICLSVGLSLWHDREETEEVAISLARATFEKDLLFRRWNAMQGRVYVVASERTPPNPFLAGLADRDLTTSEGKRLTLVNPAYMTRQIHELALAESGIQGHITSLNPLRPENAPDPWERDALLQFEQGAEEVYSLERFRGATHLRLMRPLLTEEACLKCHGAQHYRVGQIRGGISVSVPMQPLLELWNGSFLHVGIAHLILWLLGLAFIGKAARLLSQSAAELASSRNELQGAYDNLKLSQSRLLQQEKMASIGQLAAGVAHEINNPIGFVASNLNSLQRYASRLVEFLSKQDQVLKGYGDDGLLDQLRQLEQRLKIRHILADTSDLIDESLDGTERVRTIVANLKGFSRAGDGDLLKVDINDCLDKTINIIWNELKYKARIIKDYGELPPVSCYPQQLSQVFMNLLVNAAHAIDGKGEIRITTREVGDGVDVAIADTGAGIPEELRQKIFDPFFTTKPVGQGTGLGLSMVYDLVRNHAGSIRLVSQVGAGTTFTVTLPLKAPKQLQD